MQPTPPTLRELFETAADLAGGERGRYLDRHCDATQRARVEQMLAFDAEPAAALPDVPAAELASAFLEAHVPTSLPVGSHIGPFELLGVLGEGGSSTVFQARRTIDGVPQDVALKLLRRGLYSDEARRRFRHERLALSRLEHPGIARLIEGGVTGNGFAFIALELVRGVPITDYARLHRLDAKARLRSFLAVCRAVEAAHRALIVHRDLKPSNVLVTDSGTVKLLDFGIAKLLSAEDETQTQTQVGAFTPGYASPEQRDGGLVTTATDVYALGVLLGELMTGERLGDTTPRTPSECIRPGPDAGVLPDAPEATRRLLKGDIDNIVVKALQADPMLRYASAAAFADDIERLPDGRTVVAHPPSRWYRTRKFVARHKGGVMSSAAFLLAVFAALGIALWQAHAARTQAQRADAVQAFLVDIFDRNSAYQGDPQKARATTAQELLQIGARRIDAAMADAPEAKLRLLVLLGELHDGLGLNEEAAGLFRKAIALSSSRYGDHATEGFDAQIRLADSLHSANSDDQVRAILEDARATLDRHRDDDPHRRAQLADQLAQYYATRDLPKALDQARKAVALYERVPPTFDLAFALSRKARVERQSGLDGDAIESYQRAIEVSRATDGEASSDLPRYYAELSEIQYSRLDIAQGERNARAALDAARVLHGDDHVDVIQCEMRLGRLLFDTGRREEGLDLLATARRQVLAVRGTDDGFHTPAVLAANGAVLIRYGRIEAGLVDVESAIANRRRNRPGTLPLAQFLETAASALTETGRYDEAARNLDEGAEIRENAGQKRPSASFDGNVTARIELALARNEPVRAADLLAQLSSAGPGDTPDLQHLWNLLLTAQVRLASQRPEDAAALASTVRRTVDAGAFAPYDGPFVAQADYIEGEARRRQGDSRTAAPLLRAAMSLRRELFDPASPKIAEVDVALALLALEDDDLATARALAKDAAAVEATRGNLGMPRRNALRELQAAIARHAPRR